MSYWSSNSYLFFIQNLFKKITLPKFVKKKLCSHYKKKTSYIEYECAERDEHLKFV